MTKEKTLLQRARKFEEQALAEVYDRFSPGIYRYAIRLIGEDDLAEECVAETFSRFLTTLKNGGGPDDYLQAYLYRVAHNWITDTFRRNPVPDLPLQIEQVRDAQEDLSDHVDVKIQQEQVRAALRLLTPEQREVLVLKFLEDLSNQEIARVINKPVGAVKSLQHRGLAALRRIITHEEALDVQPE